MADEPDEQTDAQIEDYLTTPDRRRIVTAIMQTPLTRWEVMDAADVSEALAKRMLAEMVEDGLVTKYGGSGNSRARYELTADPTTVVRVNGEVQHIGRQPSDADLAEMLDGGYNRIDVQAVPEADE